MRRCLLLVALVLLALPFGWLVLGAIGGAIPANRDWRAPTQGGVTIWVETNGVHTGIVVPKVAAGVDWRGLARPQDIADPRYAGYGHLSFGWGERGFYLGTPTWAELRLGTTIGAALGSDDTLVHVDHVPRPVEDAQVRRLVLRPEEYRRLAAFIAASVVKGGERRHGYAGYDSFYQGRGRYDAVRTCNAWTGAALRHAGVRMGQWTPFPATVMQWL